MADNPEPSGAATKAEKKIWNGNGFMPLNQAA